MKLNSGSAQREHTSSDEADGIFSNDRPGLLAVRRVAAAMLTTVALHSSVMDVSDSPAKPYSRDPSGI